MKIKELIELLKMLDTDDNQEAIVYARNEDGELDTVYDLEVDEGSGEVLIVV